MSTLAPPWRIATAGATSNTCPASVLCLPCCAVCRTAQKGCPLVPSCLVSAHSRCHSDLVRNALQSCPVHAQACPAPAAYTPRQCQAQHPSFQPLLKLLALTCISCHCCPPMSASANCNMPAHSARAGLHASRGQRALSNVACGVHRGSGSNGAEGEGRHITTWWVRGGVCV